MSIGARSRLQLSRSLRIVYSLAVLVEIAEVVVIVAAAVVVVVVPCARGDGLK